MKAMRKRQGNGSGAALAPYSLWAMLFIIVPMAFVAYYAFTDNNFRFTTDNITRFFYYSQQHKKSGRFRYGGIYISGDFKKVRKAGAYINGGLPADRLSHGLPDCSR